MAERERREYGTGSISKHSRGGYRGRYYDNDGKRRDVYARTKRECEIKLRRAMSAAERGDAPASGRLTVEDYLTEWFERGVRGEKGWRPKTVRLYRGFIRNHLVPGLGKRKLAKLTVPEVNRFIGEMRASGLNPATINRIRGLLRTALNDADRDGLVSKNVAAQSNPPGERRAEQRPLTRRESECFLEVARGHRLQALWILALTTGARQGEVLGLTWDRVEIDDRDNARIEVRQQLQAVPDPDSLHVTRRLNSRSGRLQLLLPKSEESRRPILLTDIAIAALREHRAAQERERERAGDAWVDNDLVFATKTGTPIDPRNATRDFKGVLRRAGLPEDIRFHGLRHTAGTALAALGIDVKVVQEIMGHNDPRTTTMFYLHTSDEQRRQAIAKLNRLYADGNNDDDPLRDDPERDDSEQ